MTMRPARWVFGYRLFLLAVIAALGMYASYELGIVRGNFVAVLLPTLLAVLAVGALTQVRPRTGSDGAAEVTGFGELSDELERSRRHERPLGLVRIARQPRQERQRLAPLDPSLVAGTARCVDRVWADRRYVYLLLPECGGDAVRGAVARVVGRLRDELPPGAVRAAIYPEDGLTLGALLQRLDQPEASALQGAIVSLDVGYQQRDRVS